MPVVRPSWQVQCSLLRLHGFGQDSLNSSDRQSTEQGVLPVLQVFNEEASPYYEANAAAAADALAEMTEEDRTEANKKYSINGFLFCNVPGMNMTVGDR